MSENVITCENCGTVIEAGATECINCGTSDPTGFDRCVICGEFIDYCLGHGDNEAVRAIYAQHDDGDHVGCSPLACSPDMPAYTTRRQSRASDSVDADHIEQS